jgi:hypothetical protein
MEIEGAGKGFLSSADSELENASTLTLSGGDG